MDSLLDLKKRAVCIIDPELKMAQHWGEQPEDRHWTMDAKHDCIRRIKEVEEELLKLKIIRKELENIAPFYIPKTDN